MDALVSTDWLADHLGDADLRVLDATYHANFPGEPPRDARAEYRAGHIPGAGFLDLATLVTPGDLPNMLPSRDTVAERLAALGVGAGTRLVLYDDTPHRTAARAWWVLRHYGVAPLAILDGGLARWRAEGRPLAAGEEPLVTAAPAFGAERDDARTLADLRANLDSRTTQVIDARSAARFSGAEPDPRPGTAPGHIPGSVGLPYSRLFDADGRWKRGEALAAAFTDAGVDLDRPIVTTCGSGVTAAVLGFGLHLLGRDFALYDGSWSEWGADPSTPKAVAA